MLFTIIGFATGLVACNWLVTRFLPTQSQHDYTVSQIVSAGFQIYMIGISLYMMYIQSTTTFLYEMMFGYFVYDLINLFQKPFGRTMYVIQGHHIVTMLFIAYNYLSTPYDSLLYPLLLIILESSSLLLNVTGLLKQMVDPIHYKAIQFVTVVLYGLSRVVLFPIWIYMFGRHHLIHNTFDIAIGITIISCIAGNILFAIWFYKLLLKYLKK